MIKIIINHTWLFARKLLITKSQLDEVLFMNLKNNIITIWKKCMFSQEKINIKYSLPEEPFNIPIRVRKKLPSEKNIF